MMRMRIRMEIRISGWAAHTCDDVLSWVLSASVVLAVQRGVSASIGRNIGGTLLASRCIDMALAMAICSFEMRI